MTFEESYKSDCYSKTITYKLICACVSIFKAVGRSSADNDADNDDNNDDMVPFDKVNLAN